MSEPVLRLQGVVRTYRQARTELRVLTGTDLALRPGELVALVAPSGAGKSTLLHQAGLLERPDAGEVLIEGKATARLGDQERTRLRREKIGFVYQFHHLLADFTALENVVLPQMLAGRRRRDARVRAAELLDRVGLSGRASHRPGKLSGGEQQRVAIARALANEPALILADEPTGNLDEKMRDEVMDLLEEHWRRLGFTMIVVTHDSAVAKRAQRRITMTSGHLS